MFIKESNLKGVKIIEPKVFSDYRGFFYESFNLKEFQKNFSNINFVQDNLSLSYKNVLRGLHFQLQPYAQGKLVSVVRGAVIDVVVDLRLKSRSFGKYDKFLLSEYNKLQLWIPPGFAHGFYTLEDNTLFSYKCTNYYNKESEQTLIWNDPELSIIWDTETPIISEKDSTANTLKHIIENNLTYV